MLVASLGSYDSDANPAPPSGWTPAGANSASDGTWYRVAGASEPAGYTFTTPDGDTVAIAISAFTGVDTASPLSGTPAMTSGSGTSLTLPNGTAARAGSMRYSMASTSRVGTGAPSTTFGAGLTEACDESGESASLATAWEPVGVDRTADAALALTADDQTGTLAGWRLSASATQFTTGAATLPPTAAAAPGRCSAPTNTVGSYPIALSAIASVLFTAGAGSGAGPTNLGLAARLSVPSRARAGACSSTWTLTLASGP